MFVRYTSGFQLTVGQVLIDCGLAKRSFSIAVHSSTVHGKDEDETCLRGLAGCLLRAEGLKPLSTKIQNTQEIKKNAF